jgi:metal-responsive CopG/Arc/MetJ family transcriptional regulator
MALSRMSITLPAELLDAVVERANRDKVTRSALTIEALTAYLEGRIIEPDKQDNIEVIRLRTQLEGKDESIRRADETIDALRLALDICNKKARNAK